MPELTEQQLRQIIRSEIEAFFLDTPPWLIEPLTEKLGHAIAKKLNDGIVSEVDNKLVEALGKSLSQAIVSKVEATVDSAFLKAVARTYSDEFNMVCTHVERLIARMSEYERDNWWRRSSDEDADEDESH